LHAIWTYACFAHDLLLSDQNNPKIKPQQKLAAQAIYTKNMVISLCPSVCLI
jgi:hypothetical protein